MIKSYSLKHKIRGEGRERGHCCVCGSQVRESGHVGSVSCPGWVGLCWGYVLGLHLRPWIMKSIPCLGPSLAYAPPLLPAVSPQSPGAVGFASVCAPTPQQRSCTVLGGCLWPLSVRGSGWSICLSLDTCTWCSSALFNKAFIYIAAMESCHR